MKKKFSGYQMKKYREEENMTMAQLGAVLGVAWQQVYRWEHGEVKPNADYLIAIADALNAEPAWLFEVVEP